MTAPLWVRSTGLKNANETTNDVAPVPVSSSGDLILAVVQNNSGDAITPPSGGAWTLVHQIEKSGTARLAVYRRTSPGTTGTETWSWTIGSTAQNSVVSYHVATGHNTTTTIDTGAGAPTSQENGAAQTVATAPGLTTQVASCLLFYATQVLAGAQTSISPPTNMVERFEVLAGGARNQHVATQTLGAAAATGTRGATQASAAGSLAILVAVRPVATNQPPVAEAGGNQTVNEGVTVNLDASASSDVEDTGGAADDGGSAALTYAWTVQDAGGTGLVTGDLTGASTRYPSFTAPAVTAQSFIVMQVQVTDSGTLAATDTVTITVNDTNVPPAASAGPNRTVTVGATAQLTGSSDDPDGTVTVHAWEAVTGGAPSLSSTTISNPTVDTTGATAGDYVYRYRVQDDGGAWSGWSSMTLTIVEAGVAVGDPLRVWHTFDVPDGAATVDLEVVVPRLDGEVVLLDRATVRPGGATDWSRGGLTGLTTIDVERMVGDGTWEPVRYATGVTPDPTGLVTVDDFEIVDGQEVTYRAVASATVDDQPLSSGSSDMVEVVPEQNSRLAFLTVAAAPTLASAIEVVEWDDPTRERRAAVYAPVGRDAPDIVVAYGWSSGAGSITAQVTDPDDRRQLLELLYAGATIYVARPRETADGDGEGRWVELVGQVTPRRQVSARWDPRRIVAWTWHDVTRPEVT